jgi:hypothetical protein
MASLPRPDLIYEPTVFAPDRLREHWPDLHRMIHTGHEIAEAFNRIRADPIWQSDPRLADISPAIAEEVLDLYNDVVADGRYISEFQQDPAGVARKLKIKVSKKALELVSAVSKRMDGDVGIVAAAVVVSVSVVAVAVTTAIVSSAADRRSRILVDESGKVKLGDHLRKKRRVAKRRKPG